MRFTITDEAIDRHGLNDICRGREFSGPSIREGLLGGWPRGVIGWVKRELKVSRSEEIDVGDARLVYYLLAIKTEDATLLPFRRINDLALTDFDITRHEVTMFDQDGDCGECSQPVEALVHRMPVGLDVVAGEVVIPPTTAPASPGTTETATT